MTESISLEVLTRTFDDLPIGVGIFQVHDVGDITSVHYVYLNKVLLYEMRKTAQEVLGKRIIDVAPEAYKHQSGLLVIKTYVKVASEGGSVNLGLVEYSNELVAGTYECSVHHIKDNFIYVMLKNVTELEKTKNDLERKNQELEQFAHVASHDLKEPLNTISGAIKILTNKFQDKLDEETDQILSFMSESTTRMRKLIEDLLDYSTIGRLKQKVQIDCNKLIEVIQQDLQSKIDDTNTIFEVDNLPAITGFRTELRLLFQNLILNAIKFRNTTVTPRIKISATEEDEWIFAVEDNGIGIAEKNREKIFSVFERLHSRNKYEGTGIGLAHCKKIMDLHKGKIWVDSEPGKGSTFYFTMPK